jgi:hypothetical protein
LSHWAPSSPTTEEEKWPIAPKPGPYDLYRVIEFNIEKKFKKTKFVDEYTKT